MQLFFQEFSVDSLTGVRVVLVTRRVTFLTLCKRKFDAKQVNSMHVKFDGTHMEFN